MKQSPLVSILIPVFQRSDLVCQAIDCALNQSYSNLEIIVGDNCSKDGTYERVKEKYGSKKNVLIFQNDTNLGAVGNWKKCLEKAKGRYIKFLWSDDLMNDKFIEQGIKILESNNNISFVYSSVIVFSQTENDDNLKEIYGKLEYCFGKTGVYKGREFIDCHFYKRKETAPVSPGCAIFRRDKLCIIEEIPNKLGYIHKRNGAGVDLLCFFEAISDGELFAFINEPMNYFRDHPNSISVADSTIYVGYNTAKAFYLKKYGLSEYYSNLIEDILLNTNIFRIVNSEDRNHLVEMYMYGLKYEKPSWEMLVRIFLKKVRRKLYKIGRRKQE